MWLEREIRTKLDDTIELILRGAAADYTAYASAVARYRVLKELLDAIGERKTAEAAGEVTDDE